MKKAGLSVQAVNSFMRLALSFPTRNFVKIKRAFNHKNAVFWFYLGKNFFKVREIESALGSKFTRIDIARLHDTVADDIRREHVQWIDQLNRDNGKDLDWWFGTVSSRNVYESNLFQYVCYLEILERLCNGLARVPDLVFVESLGLAKAIEKWASKKNINIDVVCRCPSKLTFMYYYLFPLLRWGKFVATLVLRCMAARISRGKYKRKDLKPGPFAIVDTFLHDTSLSDSCVFTDRYFPYLHEYLSRKKLPVVVHPVLHGFGFNYFSIYRRMRQSDAQFIIQEDFLRSYDYYLALIYPLRVLRREIKALPFRNFDLSDILEEEKKMQSAASGLQAILIYRLFLRLGQSEFEPAFVINWYENQTIDKALIAGVRKAFPGVKIAGAQLFLHSSNTLNLFPSQSEVEAQLTPDLLIETSNYQCDIAKSFTTDVDCRPGAALRYAHLYNDKIIFKNGNSKGRKTLLVLLPFDLTVSVELLEMLRACLKQVQGDVRIVIKGHPDYSVRQLRECFCEKNWPPQFETFQGGMPEALALASFIISAGSSSSVVEAVVMGVPVIIVGRQTALNFKILSGLNMEMITECFSTTELIEAIKKYIALSPEEIKEYKEKGQKVRDLFFTPVNEETMSPFLGIGMS